MTKINLTAAVSRLIPEEIKEFFDKKPLLIGENSDEYDSLLARFIAALDPKDPVAWMYVKEICNYTWEIQRYRRIETAMINNERQEALCTLLQPTLVKACKDYDIPQKAKAYANQYISGEPSKKTVAHLAKYGLDVDSILAEAFSRKIQQLELVARMRTTAEFRREKLLNELEKHQRAFGLQVRRVIESEDAPNANRKSRQKASNKQTDDPEGEPQ
jgi:hypothetical protein